MHSADVVVLGAGIAGVSAAIHLQRRGRRVVLVDRQEPGEGTSYGNAGVIEVDGFTPIGVPRNPAVLLRFALNLEPAAHFHYRFFPRVARWIMKLQAAARDDAVARYAAAIAPLEQRAADEHLALAKGTDAERLMRDTGWLHLYASEKSFADATRDRHFADHYGARYEVLDPKDVAELEPHLSPSFHKAVYLPDTWSVSDPGGLVKAYARLFAADGGTFVHGDALSARRDNGKWLVMTSDGEVAAEDAVVALGPWSMDLLSPLGHRFPFAVKRGYHAHFGYRGNATLSRPVVDLDKGFVITPMEKGVRLTTGIEFADRDAAPTPVQLRRLEPFARDLFPLGDAVEDEPWMGSRPCLPDSRPILGKSDLHDGLWFAFGHGHLGLTLGPVTGRLLAEMMTGETPLVDPSPFAPDRF